MRTSTLGIILGVIIVLFGASIGFFIWENSNFNNIVKNESPLCITGGCKAQSNECGWLPFKAQNGQIVCGSNLFNVPGVTL